MKTERKVEKEKEEIIQKAKLKNWEFWLFRDYAPFLAHMIVWGTKQEEFEKLGFKHGTEGILYDTDSWYRNIEEYNKSSMKWAEKYFKTHKMKEITRACEKYYKKTKKEIKKLLKSKEEPTEQFRKLIDFLMPIMVYIWVTHMAEVYFYKKAKEEAGKFVKKEELDQYIGDISLPKKNNAYNIMKQWMQKEVDIKKIHKEFSWLKARGYGFTPGYTIEEIERLKKELLSKKEKKKSAEIPKKLRKLAKELQELVYLRLFRTDVLYEFIYIAKPIFKKVSDKLNIENVERYAFTDLINETPKIMPEKFAVIKEGNYVIISESIVKSETPEIFSEIKGMITQKGKTVGKVKIVMNVTDLDKVKKGDILVSNNTIPSYIPAMEKAAAFVTDEGGLTCHTAIVAREMNKPCIIGTKIATKVFKDGDYVEVDAYNGIVRKITQKK